MFCAVLRRSFFFSYSFWNSWIQVVRARVLSVLYEKPPSEKATALRVDSSPTEVSSCAMAPFTRRRVDGKEPMVTFPMSGGVVFQSSSTSMMAQATRRSLCSSPRMRRLSSG